MAINIFQGSKPTKSKAVNSASRTTRAKAVQAALTTPSVTSDSGSTAVSKTGTLQKVGNIVGKVAGVASKFLPGLGGTIAAGISNLLNDPEWWQSVPGEAVTCNTPLRQTAAGNTHWIQDSTHTIPCYKWRAAILEIDSAVTTDTYGVVDPTDHMVNAYLLPEIRKVINAVPLQSVAAYKQVLRANATLYAIWQNLKKYDYLCKHGLTYIANLDDPAFPTLQVSNAAWLQSTIGRLEEYLRSNVRLPHTLCEYLAWRYGRIYKSNDSAKSALVLYNVIDMHASVSDHSAYISNLINVASATEDNQKANSDLYNTYYDHDYQVEIREDTQVTFDRKEFCLRTNLDLTPASFDPGAYGDTPDTVYIDSNLDNPTTFMASTVSTIGTVNIAGSTHYSWLFPISKARVYIPISADNQALGASIVYSDGQVVTGSTIVSKYTSSIWAYADIMRRYPGNKDSGTTVSEESANTLASAIGTVLMCKSVDFYNKDIYITASNSITMSQSSRYAIDLTSLSMDMGLVQNSVIGNEHIYAFANLIDVSRKHSMSYKQAEALVAKDTANLVEKLDIATVK